MKKAKRLFYWYDEKGNKHGEYEYRGRRYDVDFDGFIWITVKEQHKYEQARVDDLIENEEKAKGKGESAWEGFQKFWDYIDE